MIPWRHTLFPERCLGCQEIVPSQDWLCAACFQKFPWMPEAHCVGCSAPFPSPRAGLHECGTCLTEPRSIHQVFALGIYQGLLLNLIVRMKYRHEETIAWRLGRVLAERLSSDEYDLVVPVPLHVSRLRKRAYNQAAWLAQGLAKERRLAYRPFVLSKTAVTSVQTGLTRAERLKNVRHSFQVDSDQVAGKRILLVDDVYTTGATLESCARVLKKAGAEEIDAIVVARTA